MEQYKLQKLQPNRRCQSIAYGKNLMKKASRAFFCLLKKLSEKKVVA